MLFRRIVRINKSTTMNDLGTSIEEKMNLLLSDLQIGRRQRGRAQITWQQQVIQNLKRMEMTEWKKKVGHRKK